MEKRSPKPAKRVCVNPHCRRQDIRARGRCQACYVFLRRHGRDPTLQEMHGQRRRSEKPCQNCQEQPIRARGRCQRCYQYWKRTGRERPRTGERRSSLCVNCGAHPIYRLSRCRSCYAYLSLYHKERPGA